MSEKLAISAGFSVLMMAMYVLFGAQAHKASLGPSAFTSASLAQPTASAPALPGLLGG